MKNRKKNQKKVQELLRRIIISGGGTGGHIFPAIAIANEVKKRYPDCEILFVGAKGKMEMEKVPEAGYEIIGLPIAGIQRKLTFSNFILPFKIIRSLLKARRIIKEFKPEKVVGVGGFASAALLYAASGFKIPILIQEQNSFAGITNKLLAKRASKICVAYPGMEKFFPSGKIVLTGNPVRTEIYKALNADIKEAKKSLGFNPDQTLVLIIGGSLGARTINISIQNSVRDLHANGIQIMWQTGKNFNANTFGLEGLKASVFINDMSAAYAAADIVISRAGAISVSELSLLNKPAILVPSPNVAEDHQTKNAVSLSDKGAAILVKDADAETELLPVLLNLIEDKNARDELRKNIQTFAKPDALIHIVNELESMS